MKNAPVKHKTNIIVIAKILKEIFLLIFIALPHFVFVKVEFAKFEQRIYLNIAYAYPKVNSSDVRNTGSQV